MVSELSPLRPDAHEGDASFSLVSRAVVCFAAVAHGVQSASTLATQYALKDDFDLGPAAVGFYLSLHSPGWVLKPVWGAITDSFPIRGQRRRPYLLLAAGVAALSYSWYCCISALWQFVMLLMVTHVCKAFLSIIAQAMIVERTGGERDSSNASFGFSSYFGIRTTAASCFVYVAGLLLDHEPARKVLQLCATVFIPVLMVSPFLDEPVVVAQSSLAKQWSILSNFLLDRQVRIMLVFIFLAHGIGNPIDSSAMFFFYTDVLNFTASFLGTVAVVGNAGSVLGLIVYHNFLRGFPIRPLLAILAVVNATTFAILLIQVFRVNAAFGINDHIFTLVSTFLTRFVAEMFWIPSIVLTARLCPKSVEGSAFALFLSINNLAHWQSGLSSAGLTAVLDISRHNLDNLWYLVDLCCLAMLAPLAVVPFLPALDSDNPEGSISPRAASG